MRLSFAGLGDLVSAVADAAAGALGEAQGIFESLGAPALVAPRD